MAAGNEDVERVVVMSCTLGRDEQSPHCPSRIEKRPTGHRRPVDRFGLECWRLSDAIADVVRDHASCRLLQGSPQDGVPVLGRPALTRVRRVAYHRLSEPLSSSRCVTSCSANETPVHSFSWPSPHSRQSKPPQRQQHPTPPQEPTIGSSKRR